ncbi:S1C family serine protease [Microbacterium yannicii]|uniref:S1C family serine protease n=1 Tax=Microbacterium yannicii TaxID=671622 RepID=UPI000301D90E|nr:trypsin-like peptidase domain-containing protein [Microbacterium yannicii]
MSDNQGDRPADQTPEVPPVAPAREADATPTQEPAAAPAQERTAAPAQPAQEASAHETSAPAAPAAHQPPPVPPVPPAGYPTGAHAYARPHGYAGQPVGAGSYAGQQQGAAAPSASFGRPADSQPTLPLDGAGSPPSGAGPAGTSAIHSGPKKPQGAGKVVGLIVAAAIVGGAAGLGGSYAGLNWFAPASTSPAAGPTTVTVNDTESVNQTTAIATKVVPSVVTIAATSDAGGGTGSGVVLSEDGYVVTNTHVVTLDGATGDAQIRVTTADGRVYDAEVVGTDPMYDLAVIKLTDAEGLTPIEFADSSELNVGDSTIAVGAPLGLANTVTTGIVSALNRSISIASSAAPESGDEEQQAPEEPEEGQEGPFRFDFGQGQQQQTPTQTISIAVIQTDAAINPGNSGGALVDSEGRLIGINVAIATAGGSTTEGSGSIGVGFSIPSDIVQRITDEIIDSGEATHGLLGASVQPAAAVEDATISGAYIAEVVSGGAAEAAGLEVGDVVTEFNGVPITDATDLTAQVRAAAAGSDAELTYVRDGESRTVEVTLGTLQQ